MLAAGLAAQQPGGIHLRKWSGELGFEYEFRDERSRSSFGRDLHQRENWLKELLGIRVEGDIYHRKLLDFDIGTSLQLDQRDISTPSGGPSQWSNTADVYYDGQGVLLRDKSISADFYARRGRLDTRQRFFATSTADLTDFGGNLRFKEIWIPSVLHYEDSRYIGHGLDTLRQNTQKVQLEGNRLTEWSSIQYSLERNDVDQASFGTRYRESVARASASQRFGDGRHSVRAGGYYREQTGDQQSRFKEADGMLHLQLLPELYWENQIVYDTSEITNGTTSKRDDIEVYSVLRHRLYESLDTALSGRYNKDEFDAGDFRRLEGSFEMAYRKRTSFGAIGLTYRPTVYRQEETGGSLPVPVIDEPLTYTAGVPMFLRFFNADPTTVFVTDSLGTTNYVQPADYVLVQEGPRTRIDIPVGSRILDGATILVDYTYDPSPDKTYRSVTHDVGLSLEFGNYANLAFEHATENVEILSGMNDGSIGNSERNAVRARLAQWDQELTAEYESWENIFAPYERTQVGALSRLQLASDKQWHNSARWYRTRFRDLQGEEYGVTLNSTLDWRISNPVTAFFRAEYHNVRYRIDKGDGYLLETGLDYRVQNTTASADLRYTVEDFDIASDQNLFYFLFSFRRRF
ncbi:MAG: hypothetical protein Fur0037_23460 [Planctomycetota bacterium]